MHIKDAMPLKRGEMFLSTLALLSSDSPVKQEIIRQLEANKEQLAADERRELAYLKSS